MAIISIAVAVAVAAAAAAAAAAAGAVVGSLLFRPLQGRSPDGQRCGVSVDARGSLRIGAYPEDKAGDIC